MNIIIIMKSDFQRHIKDEYIMILRCLWDWEGRVKHLITRHIKKLTNLEQR